MGRPPKVKSESEKELEKVEKQFEEFDNQVKQLTLDRMNEAPKLEVEQQTKLSQKEIERSKEIVLKPTRSIAGRDKFNERFREDWNYAKQYVRFIAENKEIIGEAIEMWTKPFAGIPAEFWTIPTNKVINAPRYVAEQIKRCTYHRLVMQETHTQSDGMGTYYGQMAADQTINRLDAHPVNERKSVFMGSGAF